MINKFTLSDNKYPTGFTKKNEAAEVIQKTGVSAGQLRYWEKLGIVQPEHGQRGVRKSRGYSLEDIHRVALAKALVDSGKYTLEGAIRELREVSLSH